MARRCYKITDHARTRFAERAIGISLEELDERILPAAMDKALAKTVGGRAKVKVGDHWIVIKDHTVVTVITKDGQED